MVFGRGHVIRPSSFKLRSIDTYLASTSFHLQLTLLFFAFPKSMSSKYHGDGVHLKSINIHSHVHFFHVSQLSPKFPAQTFHVLSASKLFY